MDDTERAVITWVRGEFISGEGRLFEHVTATFRWLMATLFAASGGGLVALLDSGAHDLPGRNYALAWFALGVVSSLAMGALSTFFAMRTSVRMNAMRAKLDASLITGEVPDADLLKFVEEQKPTWKTWIPSYAGGASLTFFVIGLATIAGSLLRAG